MPTWCQIICNHHDDEGQSVHFKKARHGTDASYNASKYIGQSTTPDQPCQLMVRTRSKEILDIDVETKWPPFPDDIFKGIFVNENVWIWLKISLKFVSKLRIDNITALVKIMAWRLPGGKPLSEPMLVSLLTDICVTWPQRFNISHIWRSCVAKLHDMHFSRTVGRVLLKRLLWNYIIMEGRSAT